MTSFSNVVPKFQNQRGFFIKLKMNYFINFVVSHVHWDQENMKLSSTHLVFGFLNQNFKESHVDYKISVLCQ